MTLKISMDKRKISQRGDFLSILKNKEAYTQTTSSGGDFQEEKMTEVKTCLSHLPVMPEETTEFSMTGRQNVGEGLGKRS